MSTTTDADVPIVTSLSPEAAKTVAAAMQPTLEELIDMALTGKQLHWAVVGKRFKPVHEHLDELIEEHREYSDMVAEYMSTIGIIPDGRAVRVASDATIDPIDAAFPRRRDGHRPHDRPDQDRRGQHPRSHASSCAGRRAAEDLLIQVTRVLDKQLWMTSAQR